MRRESNWLGTVIVVALLLLFVTNVIGTSSTNSRHPSTSLLSSQRQQQRTTTTKVAFVGSLFGSSGGGGGAAKLPTTTNDRDNQAINAVQAALRSPKTPSLPLIECEFPPVKELNKLGDGSRQSAITVNAANIDYTTKLARTLSPLIPGTGALVTVITSSTATNQFITQLSKQLGKSIPVHSFQNGVPLSIKSRDIFICITPSISQDYALAKQLANKGNPVIIVNGFAKDQRSIPNEATMGYYYKPITYNSQVAGYVIRSYPGPWTVLSVSGGKTTKTTVLGTFTDKEILVPGTNTPDLRSPVKLVQTYVDKQAILSRSQR